MYMSSDSEIFKLIIGSARVCTCLHTETMSRVLLGGFDFWSRYGLWAPEISFFSNQEGGVRTRNPLVRLRRKSVAHSDKARRQTAAWASMVSMLEAGCIYSPIFCDVLSTFFNSELHDERRREPSVQHIGSYFAATCIST